MDVVLSNHKADLFCLSILTHEKFLSDQMGGRTIRCRKINRITAYLLQTDSNESFPCAHTGTTSQNVNKVKSILETLCPGASMSELDTLYALLSPEKYHCDDIVWEQGDASESLKLVVECSLISLTTLLGNNPRTCGISTLAQT